MQCAKMQGSTKSATVLDPSSSHFANALQISASGASPAQIILVSGDSSINESRQEDRHNKSSWIRRLKPRDGPELPKGGSAEASLETTYSEEGKESERMDRGSRIVQPGWFLQEKAANRVSRPKLSLGVERVSDVKRQKMSEQKDLNVIEKRRSTSCQEKTSMAKAATSTTSSAMALPSNAGFGPWVNLSRKSDMNPESILGSKGIIGTATACTQELSRDSQRNFCSAFTSTNPVPRCSPVSMVGDVTASSVFSKSPLSPAHSKIGLPPRPPSQKSPGFHPPIKVPSISGMGQGGFKQFAQDSQPNRQVYEAPSNSESKHSAGVQDKRMNELTEAAVARCGSLFQMAKPAEQSFFDSTRDHGKGSSECGQQLFDVASMGNSNLPIRQARSIVAERANTHIVIGQPLDSFSNGAAVEFENNRRGICEDLHLDVPTEGVSGPICTNVSSDVMDLHIALSAPGIEHPKSVLKNGTTNVEPNKASMQSPSGSHGTSKGEKADASVSTSASLPWEMFIESAGASRIAREKFVETYNRARDELKNQRLSQRSSRAQSKETDAGPKLTLGPGDTASDHTLRRQLLKHEQHVAGHSQTQGRLSTIPEHRTPAASKSREQHLINHVESKGPAPTFANYQSGLIRDNNATSKFETPWKQGDDVRIEQSRPEGLSRSNVNNLLQKGGHQDNGQVFPIASAANTTELASSKRCKGNVSAQQVARLSHQLELASAVGKSSQEYSMTRASEEGVGSGLKPLSRPHVWLQRWHPTGVHNFKGSPDTQGVPSDGKRSDLGALGLKKFKDGDGVGIFGRSRELKNVSDDKETGVKSLKSSPSKVLPSAAAMAIVGTAARQFCATQPQRKGSFAFWSGYGVPPPRKVEPVQEKGKAKMFVKDDVDMTNC